VVLSNYVISNVNEYWGVKRFLNRHTRWGKLRWHIGGARYLPELIGNAVFVAFLPLLFAQTAGRSVLLAAAVCSIKVARDYYIGKKLDAKMNPLLYLFIPIKDFLIGCIWFVPILDNKVAWRGNKYIIGKESRLFRCPAEVSRHPGPGIISSIRTKLALSRS
jgi:ceramide glucosyltransferase